MNEFIIRIATVGDDREVSALLDASYSTLLRGHYKNELLVVALPLMTKANRICLHLGPITSQERLMRNASDAADGPRSGPATARSKMESRISDTLRRTRDGYEKALGERSCRAVYETLKSGLFGRSSATRR